MRYASNSPTKLVATSTRRYYPIEDLAEPRSATRDQLRSPALYALSGWGLSEMLRVFRQRADLTVDQVAKGSDVDPALLYRLEAVQRDPQTANINITLDGLFRVCEFLCIPLPQLIWQAYQTAAVTDHLWNPDEDEKRLKKAQHWPVLACDAIKHELHVSSIQIPLGSTYEPQTFQSIGLGTLASWIVIEGTADVLLKTRELFLVPGGSVSPTSIQITEGSVAHFREASPVRVTARTPTKIIQIVHSTYCSCSVPVGKG